MPKEIDLIEILQKLYAGEADLHISSGDEGWKIELDDSGHGAFARRLFTPDDIAELPKWIEAESAKPRASQLIESASWPRVAHLRVVK